MPFAFFTHALSPSYYWMHYIISCIIAQCIHCDPYRIHQLSNPIISMGFPATRSGWLLLEFRVCRLEMGDGKSSPNPSSDGEEEVRRDMPAKKKVVVVMGATGAGKSKLAIDLASHLPCPIEIVNADSMQVYQGLDVLTNKVPLSERQGPCLFPLLCLPLISKSRSLMI